MWMPGESNAIRSWPIEAINLLLSILPIVIPIPFARWCNLMPFLNFRFGIIVLGLAFSSTGVFAQHSGHNQTQDSSYYSDSSQLQMQGATPSQIGKRYVQPGAIPQAPAANTITDSVTGYDAKQLTLDDLISIAEANNPTLRQAQMQITGEMGKAIQAGLYPNPTLRYSAEQIGVGGTPGEFHGGILSQEFVTSGKLRLSRAKYLQRVKVAEANAVAQQYRVCNDVRIHFYNTLSLQRQVTIQDELVKSAEDSAVTAREAFNMGQANAADIRRTNVALQQARLTQLRTQNMLRQSQRHLSSLLGMDITGSFLVGELESAPIGVDFETLLANLLGSSPEMIAARAKSQADRIAVQRERAEPIPNLTFEGGAGYNFEADETVAVAGVSLKLPLFDKNQGTIQQAQADLARQCAEIRRLELRLKRDLSQQYEHYLTAVQHVSQYQQIILPELKETYRLLLESYKENRTDWKEVLMAQTGYFKSRVEYTDWLAKMRNSEVLIDGMLLHGGLMAAEGAAPAGHIDAVAKPR